VPGEVRPDPERFSPIAHPVLDVKP
jgi:hypothetical protein